MAKDPSSRADTGARPAPRRDLISITETAERLGVSEPTVRNLIDAGQLAERRLFRRRLVVAASVAALVGNTGGAGQ